MPVSWLHRLPAVSAVMPVGAAVPGRLPCPPESHPLEWQGIFGWLWETNVAAIPSVLLSVSYGRT